MEWVEEAYMLIPGINALMRRVTPIHGDMGGNKKLHNYKELQYVFHIADWTSSNFLRHLDEAERKVKAKEAAKLDDNWKPDKIVLDAIEGYIEYQAKLSPSSRALIAAERSVLQTAKYLESLNEQNEVARGVIDKINSRVMSMKGDELLKGTAELQSAKDVLEKNVKTNFTLIEQINKANSTIKLMRAIVFGEMEKSRRVRGDRPLGRREEPREKTY